MFEMQVPFFFFDKKVTFSLNLINSNLEKLKRKRNSVNFVFVSTVLRNSNQI